MDARRFLFLRHPVLPAWDGHCHLAGCPGRTTTERMHWLVEHAERLGIERLIVFMGYPFVYDPDPAELRRQNDQVLQALEHWHDRAFGYCYVSPKHPEASTREIDRCVRDGPMVGIKLWVAERCTSAGTAEIVAHARQYGAIVFQHTWLKTTGNLPGESTPEDLAELARRFPDVTFVCGHAGGNWRLGLHSLRDVPNVLVETAGADPVAGFVERAVSLVGERRVIYGSDAGGRSFASQLGKVYGANLTQAQKRLILKENLHRALEPILHAKGLR